MPETIEAMIQPAWENEAEITAYAIRTAEDAGWVVDGARASLAEIEAGWRQARGGLVEIRQLGAPFKGFDPPSWARGRARDLGWWFDLRCGCWRAPDEFIDPPATPAEECEGLACAFDLPEFGWLNLTLAYGSQSARVRFSSSYDPIPNLLEWLEKLCAFGYPRMMIEEEGSGVEFHVLPGTLRKTHYTRYDEISPRTRFIVLSDTGSTTARVMLDLLIPHRILVAAIYGAYRAVIRLAPLRFHTEWRRFVADPDLDEFELLEERYPLRSVAVERWLWGEIAD